MRKSEKRWSSGTNEKGRSGRRFSDKRPTHEGALHTDDPTKMLPLMAIRELRNGEGSITNSANTRQKVRYGGSRHKI
jgi:hypothetical protein